jgi:hypothetical protein
MADWKRMKVALALINPPSEIRIPQSAGVAPDNHFIG